MVVLYQQAVRQAVGGFVALPVGSYIVSLIVQDNAGRNASTTQVGVKVWPLLVSYWHNTTNHAVLCLQIKASAQADENRFTAGAIFGCC
jgi:hypothetical protein